MNMYITALRVDQITNSKLYIYIYIYDNKADQSTWALGKRAFRMKSIEIMLTKFSAGSTFGYFLNSFTGKLCFGVKTNISSNTR